jgi:uncharacterized DUF497 family protein
VTSEGKLTSFEWDPAKEQANLEKHGVSCSIAQFAFADQKRIILKDITHSTEKKSVTSASVKWEKLL